MSRIGKQPIPLPPGVKADVSGRSLQVEGPKGKLSVMIDPMLAATVDGGRIHISVADVANPAAGARHGLTRNLVRNMVKGVSEGHMKELQITGVGYRANLKGGDLELLLGYSHPVVYRIPEGITISVEKQTKVTITGADRQVVGQAAAEIRRYRKPEPYKGKGIKYSTETIRRKAGKTAATAAAT